MTEQNKEKILNVRLDELTDDLVSLAVKHDGAESRSEWVRSALREKALDQLGLEEGR